MTRVGIVGYGNLGKGVEAAIANNEDMQLVAVFTRRDPSTLKLHTQGVSVYSVNDILAHKIGEVDKKVDMMAAVRPYQDALINAKIDKNALISDFNLHRRTCKMIEGQLVLPDNLISGYTSVNM